MNERDTAWLRHQQQRWMRPDAHRWLRPDAARFLKPGTDPAEFFAAYQRKFNPHQPRVPKGNPGGGQWASEEGGGGSFEDIFNNDDAASDSGDTASDTQISAINNNISDTPQTFLDILRDKELEGRVQLIQDRGTRYRVNLEEEELFGGHTLRDHVGKTDDELMAVVRPDRGQAGINRYARIRQGSFESKESANDFVNRTLERYQDVVDSVANGEAPEAFLKLRFGRKTGREAFRPDVDAEPYLRDTYEVGVYIIRDRRTARGYRIETSYPRNESPR